MIPDEMLSKEERFTKTKDFRRAYKEGGSVRAAGLIFYHLANGLNKNRIGLSVPSRFVKLANRRNRLRRLLREIYRRNKKALKEGHDIVLVVKRDLAGTLSYKGLEDLFLRLAKKAGILS